jgi:hypothetical protein
MPYALGPSPVILFNLKQHEMEKRRRRELEKAGIDPDDDAPWIAPEEQQRIDDEAAQRKAEENERVKKLLAERDKEDAEKRKKFKEFRAKQLKMSKDRKQSAAEIKSSQSIARESRMINQEVDVAAEEKMKERGDLGDAEEDAAGVEDRDQRRSRLAEQRRLRKEEEGDL